MPVWVCLYWLRRSSPASVPFQHFDKDTQATAQQTMLRSNSSPTPSTRVVPAQAIAGRAMAAEAVQARCGEAPTSLSPGKQHVWAPVARYDDDDDHQPGNNANATVTRYDGDDYLDPHNNNSTNTTLTSWVDFYGDEDDVMSWPPVQVQVNTRAASTSVNASRPRPSLNPNRNRGG